MITYWCLVVSSKSDKSSLCASFFYGLILPRFHNNSFSMVTHFAVLAVFTNKTNKWCLSIILWVFCGYKWQTLAESIHLLLAWMKVIGTRLLETVQVIFVLFVLKSTKSEKVSHPSSAHSLMLWHNLTIHPFSLQHRKAIHSSSLFQPERPSISGRSQKKKTLASMSHVSLN